MTKYAINVVEILQTAEFVVDARGSGRAVPIGYKVRQGLPTAFEDWEDVEEIGRLRESGKEAVPWEQAKN